ncbi:protein of unknown function [Zhouia amylolytica]|uniref:DUF4296 domain-containing protein n=2 Tax=Zhouia amylolytica TaxID=376730 RepID=W2UK18_9FLAO|nr:DUF4296 domain-containing protein [Zhouia amylolytica]ETN93781.1 hypothetical protein P278_31910 [Zhouia amylolytica AD3]MCQ0111772.1 DUF4296 domain-containing protein [Zhouia amylolytica]SFS35686.1 protein of unknown function [Zhouia amylolytica]
MSILKNILIVFGTVLLLVSCETNVVEKPENLIEEDEMVAIFYDIAVLNAARSSNVKVLRENEIQPEEFIYEKHKIDSLQLARSSVYYASKPNIHLRIFQRVEERLKEEKALADSLMRNKRTIEMEKNAPVIKKNDSLTPAELSEED